MFYFCDNQQENIVIKYPLENIYSIFHNKITNKFTDVQRLIAITKTYNNNNKNMTSID